MKADPERDFVRLGENFFIGFLYGDVPDESEFLRTARSIWYGHADNRPCQVSKHLSLSVIVPQRNAFDWRLRGF